MLVLLAAIGALGSVAIHLIVPAMPDIAADLEAAPSAVQLAVSLYLVGMASGQLVGGAASDRFGRRPIILAATALFAAGSMGAALAGTVGVLLICRVAQAAGGGAAIVCARAMVADVSEPEALSGRIAFMTSILLISPALSPALGGLIAGGYGWRANFLLLALCGAGLFAAGFFRLRESGGEHAAVQGRGDLRARYGTLLRSAPFWRLTIVLACSSSAMYAFLTASSFLMIEEYGLSPAKAGLCYLFVAGAGILGTFAVRAFERRGGALRLGVGISLAGAVLLLGAGLLGARAALALIAPMLVVAFGVGVSSPSVLAAVLREVKGAAGTASSLAGAAQMFASGLTTTLIAQCHVQSLLSLALPMVAMIGLGFLLAPAGRGGVR